MKAILGVVLVLVCLTQIAMCNDRRRIERIKANYTEEEIMNYLIKRMNNEYYQVKREYR